MSKITNKFKKVLKDDFIYSMDEENPYIIKEYVSTDCFILNALLGNGDIFGGIPKGKRITFAGPSSTGKSLLTAYVAKNYLDNVPKAHLIAFETEGASFYDMMESINVDSSRVTIIGVNSVEKFRSSISKVLDTITKDRKDDTDDTEYIFLLDSLGMLPTEKEINDAKDEKYVADMTRAKTIRSIFRIITMDLFKLQIPFLIVNHSYASMSLYSSQQQGGGEGPKYASDVVIMLTKAKAKEGTEHIGAILSLTVQKSRFIPENIKAKVMVLFKKGIMKYSHLLDLGLDLNIIKKEGISYVLNDVKMKRTDILKEPEKFYTSESLEILRNEILNTWSFGHNSNDEESEDLISEVDIDG